MKNLVNFVSEYLQQESDYAIQIVGKWGSGKTYYYKNILEEIISKKQVYNNYEKKYKPIYVSLFGLKSVEDISDKIVLEFYQSKFFKSYFKGSQQKKSLHITGGILKIGLRGFLNFHKLGNINDYLTDIQQSGKYALSTNELLICFDDLERLSTSVKINDVVGYINSLVDENIKVLIIANEDLLLKQDENYAALKEKVIGITVEYSPDNRSVLLEIISKKFGSFPVYKNFLISKIDYIESYSTIIDNNYRDLIYSLNSFHHIYSIIKNDIIEKETPLSQLVESQLDNITSMSLIFALEFKQSKLNFSDIDKYGDVLKILVFDNTYTQSDGKAHQIDLLFKKYNLNTDNYFFYESIFKYVTGYDDFSSENFITEFQQKFHTVDGETLPQYKIINLLSYENVYELSDEDYERYTKQVIEYGRNGEYDFITYITLIRFAERFNNILNFDLVKVEEQLKEGFDIAISKNKDRSDLRELMSAFRVDGDMMEVQGHAKNIYEYGLEKLNVLLTDTNNNIIEKFSNSFFDNLDKLEWNYKNDIHFKTKFYEYSIFNLIDLESAAMSLANSNNRVISFFKHILDNKYSRRPHLLDLDRDKLLVFSNHLNVIASNLEKENPQSIKAYLIKNVVKKIMELT